MPGTRQNSPAWYEMETPAAKVVGTVGAAILDHHGYLDAMNESLVATLSAQIWTISDDHLSMLAQFDPAPQGHRFPNLDIVST